MKLPHFVFRWIPQAVNKAGRYFPGINIAFPLAKLIVLDGCIAFLRESAGNHLSKTQSKSGFSHERFPMRQCSDSPQPSVKALFRELALMWTLVRCYPPRLSLPKEPRCQEELKHNKPLLLNQKKGISKAKSWSARIFFRVVRFVES